MPNNYLPPSAITTEISSPSTTIPLQPTTQSSQLDQATRTQNSAPTSTSLSNFKFYQITSRTQAYTFQEDQILTAPFDQLCPSGNCINDCYNFTRLFQFVPDHIQIDPWKYGRPDGSNPPDVTFFGLCSNLANVTALAYTDAGSKIKSIFPVLSATEGITASRNVALNISNCFSNTCESTRDPSICTAYCSAADMVTQDNFLDIGGNTYKCISVLCSSDCALPYANTDIFGIGIIVSYFIQGLLILLCALIVTQRYISCNRERTPAKTPSRLSERFDNALKELLLAECYNGLSTAIASLTMTRKTSDPVTSYALLYVSLIGILYPIFTLMLLHIRRVYTWSSSLLTIISWSLSTAVLFKIVGHLRQPPTEADSESGFKSLFDLQTCGGSSAMALCQQMMGQNPLENFSSGYERLHFFPVFLVIWAISTFVLLLLLGNFISSSASPLPRPFDKLKFKKDKLNCLFSRRLAAIIIALLQFIIICLYIAAISYQVEIVRQYLRWDVIDTHGWTFGQIVAVLTLAPSLIGFLSCLKHKLCDRPHQYGEINDSPEEEHGAAYGERESAAETVRLEPKRYTATISSVASTYSPTVTSEKPASYHSLYGAGYTAEEPNTPYADIP